MKYYISLRSKAILLITVLILNLFEQSLYREETFLINFGAAIKKMKHIDLLKTTVLFTNSVIFPIYSRCYTIFLLEEMRWVVVESRKVKDLRSLYRNILDQNFTLSVPFTYMLYHAGQCMA